MSNIHRQGSRVERDIVAVRGLMERAVRSDMKLDAYQSMQIAERVRVLRGALDLSQRQLASKAGVAPATVAHIEQGIANPTLSTMLCLVRALGLRSIEELIAPLPTSLVRGDEPEKGHW